MHGFKNELLNNILPFWIEKMVDQENGGFYGRIDGYNILHKDANKGAVLNARLLWTFSAAYRIIGDNEYLRIATRAYDYIKLHFLDKKHGGVYWELDCKGNPVNTKKQVYAQGFALYGFSEYYRATGNKEALQLAINLFEQIEKHKDKLYGGYFEAFTREWQPIADMRLSEKDANEKKSMNTHLHILEPYTNLLRIWNDHRLIESQRELIYIFRDKILNRETNHQSLFFSDAWEIKSSAVSYGHDIEASWLLYEAAEVLGDEELLYDIKDLSIKIADAAAEGIDKDGSMIYEKDGQHIDSERHWWVQAEAVVGYMYAYKNTKDMQYNEKAKQVWSYIKNNMIDSLSGEWYWSRLADGSVNTKDDKAGFWKCPYHNGRMCMEMIENFGVE